MDPQQSFQVTDNKTGKSYKIDWQGEKPPTDDDIDEILSKQSVPDTKPKEPATFGGRIKEFGTGIVESVKHPLDTLSGINKSYNRLFGNDIEANAKDNYDESKIMARQKSEPLSTTLKESGKAAVSLAGLNPDNISKDWNDKNYGALAGDVLPPIALVGAAKGFKALRGSESIIPVEKPPVTEIPDVGPPKQLGARPASTSPDRMLPAIGETTNIPDVKEPSASQGIPLNPDTRFVSGKLGTVDVTNPNPVDIADPVKARDTSGATVLPHDVSPPTGELDPRTVAQYGTAPDKLVNEVRNPFGSLLPSEIQPAQRPTVRTPSVSQPLPSAPVTKGITARPSTPDVEPIRPKVDEIPNSEPRPAARPRIGNVEVTRPGLSIDPNAPKNVDAPVKQATPQVDTPVFGSTKMRVGAASFLKKNPVLNDLYSKWVNTRATGGQRSAQAFDTIGDKVKDLTVDDIPAFQKELANNPNNPVRAHFDKMFQFLKDKGVEIERKDNYLPQMWEDDAATVKAKLGEKTLSLRAPFTYKSVFKDYESGIKAGLTPSMTPGELIDWYTKRATKLGADVEFFNGLRENGYIKPEYATGTKGWKNLDSNTMPHQFTMDAEGKPIGTNWKADPSIKSVIDNYLQSGDKGFFGATGAIAGRMAGTILSSGIPKVPILSGHGTNVFIRSLATEGLKTAGKAIKEGLPLANDADYLKTNRPTVIKAIEDGLHLKNTDYTYQPAFEGAKNPITKSLNWLDKKQYDYFRKPLFNEMIPKLMVESYKDAIKAGESGPKAAARINAEFGHINYDLLGRSKEFQNIMKTVFFAPSWLESNARVMGQGAHSVKMAGRVAAMYAIGNVVNKTNSGHYMWDNPEGREFAIDMGESSDGSRRYLKPGTALDMFKVPLETAMEGIKGNFNELPHTAYNKLSVPGKLTADFTTGEDWQGNPLINKDKDQYGHTNPVGTRLKNSAFDVIGSTSPSLVQGAIDMGRNGFERGLSTAVQAPFLYSKEPKKKPGSNNLSGLNIKF